MTNRSQYRPSADGRVWRPRYRNEELLDFPSSRGRIPGSLRCRAIGLVFGDCKFRRVNESAYCYYHDKVQRGVTHGGFYLDPGVPEEWAEAMRLGAVQDGGLMYVEERRLYPVLPLPRHGYVFEEEEAA